jgi:hypothetical protein
MQILKALNQIMTEIGPIGKDKVNQQQGFRYRSIDTVMDKLQHLLVKYGVVIVPKVIDIKRDERVGTSGKALISTIVTIEYTFFCTSDDSSVTVVVAGEGMDSGDKSTSKALAIAYKYACLQLLCIPTTETAPESDSESFEVEVSPRVKLMEELKALFEEKYPDGAPVFTEHDKEEARKKIRMTGPGNDGVEFLKVMVEAYKSIADERQRKFAKGVSK